MFETLHNQIDEMKRQTGNAYKPKKGSASNSSSASSSSSGDSESENEIEAKVKANSKKQATPNLKPLEGQGLEMFLGKQGDTTCLRLILHRRVNLRDPPDGSRCSVCVTDRYTSGKGLLRNCRLTVSFPVHSAQTRLHVTVGASG
eukprot:1057974-Rhodomonas_salina.3